MQRQPYRMVKKYTQNYFLSLSSKNLVDPDEEKKQLLHNAHTTILTGV